MIRFHLLISFFLLSIAGYSQDNKKDSTQKDTASYKILKKTNVDKRTKYPMIKSGNIIIKSSQNLYTGLQGSEAVRQLMILIKKMIPVPEP